MRIVSLNAWGGQCWGALEGWICDINADILCLQEVIRSPDGAPDWLTYVDPNRRLQQRPNLFDDVSKRLRDHAAWFSPSAQGPLSDDGGRAYMTQHGLGVWVRKSLPVTGLHTGFAYGRFRPCGWGSEPVPRALQFVRVWEPQSGCEIVIGHFHGIRHPAGKGDLPERQEQTETVSAQLQIFRDPTLPCILAGDFNILPDNMFFAEMENFGLRDQVVGRGFSDTRTSLYRKPQRYANYLLCSDDVRVDHFDLPAKPEVSDHRAMVLDFSLG